MLDDVPQRLQLPDGRSLTWAAYGCAEGPTVLALHGTPGSRLKFAPADAAARRHGLRLIAVDRWGYGGSGRPARPSLSAYAADVSALADAHGIDRFAVLGVSGGGPFAAAVAAELGDRVGALALVAPVGPIAGTRPAPSLSPFHALCFRVLPRVPGAIRATFAVFRGLLAVSGKGALAVAACRSGSADRRMTCDPAAREGLATAFRIGLAGGLDGPVIDMALFARDWGIALGGVRAPARLWLGDCDTNVPRDAAIRLARLIPRCELMELPGQGHYWITHHHDEVLDWIARQ